MVVEGEWGFGSRQSAWKHSTSTVQDPVFGRGACKELLTDGKGQVVRMPLSKETTEHSFRVLVFSIAWTGVSAAAFIDVFVFAKPRNVNAPVPHVPLD